MQMKIINQSGYTAEERAAHAKIVQSNAVTTWLGLRLGLGLGLGCLTLTLTILTLALTSTLTR